MADVLLRRDRLLTLRPADGLAEEEIGHFPMGRDLLCTLKRARSNPNLRHYMACLTRLAEALGLPNKDPLHEMLKIECGLVTPISTAGGLKLVADSVAFDRLGESDFIAFKRRAFDACAINFGIDPTTLSREGAELLGKTYTPQAEQAGTVASIAAPDHGSSPAPAANPLAAGGQPSAGGVGPNAQVPASSAPTGSERRQ